MNRSVLEKDRLKNGIKVNRIIFVALCVGLLLYIAVFQTKTNAPKKVRYRTKPQALLVNQSFQFWKDKAVAVCNQVADDYQIKPEDCEAYIEEKNTECRNQLAEMFASSSLNESTVKIVMKDYFFCISPKLHCQGDEIINEEDFKRLCKR